MNPSLGSWGVPDFGSVIQRDRVSREILRNGTRPVILHGSPGSGKSIAAANYASGIAKTAIWIDACGEFLTADQITARVLSAMSSALAASGSTLDACARDASVEELLPLLELGSGGKGVCVIVDDQGAPPDIEAERAFGRLARLVRSAASQVLITTRSTHGWSPEMLCDWELIGDAELALDASEASAMLERSGLVRVLDQAEILLSACKGHPALFAVMSSQAASFGIDEESERSAPLNAWLNGGECEGVCVIVDDQGPPPDIEAERAFGRLARLVRSAASQLLITTRSTQGWSPEMLCDWELIGDAELALDSLEASAMLERSGLSRLLDQADTLLSACKGHPALFAVMSSQAASFGIDEESERSSSLNAWLIRLIAVQMSPECRHALCLASLVKSGSEKDLELLGVDEAGSVLLEMASTLPLVSCSVGADGLRFFRTHDLVDGFVADRRASLAPTISSHSLAVAVELLSEEGRLLSCVQAAASEPGVRDWRSRSCGLD